jgi:hypothetical protein
MKKVVLATLVTCILTLTGCASAPSPWAGVPHEEVNAWKGIGVKAYDAKSLRGNGFTPTDASGWIQAGIHSPNDIVTWHRAGFSPREASKWLSKGFTVEKALEFKKQGLTVAG